MSKERLISHIVEKARISTQRAELAYDAFWESIISELKTGGFSLPYGAGVIHLKEKPGSALKEFAKASGIKSPSPEKVSNSKPAASEKKASKDIKQTSKAPAKAKDKGKAAPAKSSSKPAKKAPAKKAPAKKAPAKKTAKAKKK